MISIQADVQAVQEALSGTAKSIPAIEKAALRAVAKSVQQKENQLFNTSDFKHGNVLLAHTYSYSMRSVFKVGKVKNGMVSIYPKKYDSSRSNDITRPILSALSYGATYTEKGKGGYSHTIAPRGFIQSAELYAENGDFSQELQNVVDKELDKYWG